MMNRVFRLNIYMIMALATLVRITVFFIMPDVNFPDSRTYMESAQQLFSIGEINAHNVMPLHPILLGILGDYFWTKVFNISISVLSVYVLYRLVLSVLYDDKKAIFAALMMSLYPFFVFYSITSLTETFYVFLILSFFLALYNKKIVIGSALIVLSILLRPTLDILAPILIFIFSYFLHKSKIQDAIFDVFKYVLIYIVMMSPWWFHQYNKYGEFVRLNLGDGIVLYSGNNNINKSGGGVSNSVKGRDMDLSKFSSIGDPIKKNEAMKASAYQFIINNPKRFVELAGLKFIRFWRLWPYAAEYEKPIYIVMSLMSYGVVLLLSLFFIFSSLPKYFIRILPMLTVIAYFTAVHMVLVGSIRYRLPVEPFLLIFSSTFLIDKLNLDNGT